LFSRNLSYFLFYFALRSMFWPLIYCDFRYAFNYSINGHIFTSRVSLKAFTFAFKIFYLRFGIEVTLFVTIFFFSLFFFLLLQLFSKPFINFFSLNYRKNYFLFRIIIIWINFFKFVLSFEKDLCQYNTRTTYREKLLL